MTGAHNEKNPDLEDDVDNTARHNAASRLARLIGKRVRRLRHTRGWMQEDLVAAVDGPLSRSAVSYLETGRKAPSLQTLVQLAAAFEVEPAVLLLDPDTSPCHQMATAILCCPEATLHCIRGIPCTSMLEHHDLATRRCPLRSDPSADSGPATSAGSVGERSERERNAK